MDIIGILVALLIFCIIGYLAYYIITTFFPQPMKTVALAIVGVVLLILLLSYAGGYIPLGHSAVVVR